MEEVHTGLELITLRPLPGGPSGLFATNVCFDDRLSGTSRLPLIGLEFAPREALADTVPLDEFDLSVLTSIAGIIRRFGKEKRFGVRLLHDPLKLKGEVLFVRPDAKSLDLPKRCGRRSGLR